MRDIPILETEAAFSEAIRDHRVTVIDFFSTECPPCEKLAPIFHRVADRFPEVHFVKMYRQGNRAFAESLGVRSSPTLLFAVHGTIIEERLSGDISEAQIEGVLLKYVSPREAKAAPVRMTEKRDLCIIGTGPAGLTASVYASRYHVDHVLVGELTGGYMTSSHLICNYPSEIEISGHDLTEKMWQHAMQLGAAHHAGTVTSVTKRGSHFLVQLSGGEMIQAKTVLVASGTKHRKLGLALEERLLGRGVSYCATCDAAFYRNKTVAVVGGGDSANKAALYLADIAEKVYQVYRGSALKGEPAWASQVMKHPKISVLFETQLTAISGDATLASMTLNKPFSGASVIPIHGLFIEIGSDPDTGYLSALAPRVDEKGYLVTKPDQRTNKKGIWAAGDITTNSNSFRQIITACSEGAIAAESIFQYLQKQK